MSENMKNNRCILTKDEFINAIKKIQEVEKYIDDLNDCFYRHEVDGYIYSPNCANTLIEVLEKVMGDKNEWIFYFCYELDFGEDYEDGKVTDEHGDNISLKDAGELYDFLIAEMEN